MGTVGEPINPEAWVWYYQVIGGGALPGRRHVVADRDRRHHDQRAAGRDHAEARERDVPAARHRGRHRRRRGRAGRHPRRRLPRARTAVAVDAARHLGRPAALPRHLLEPLRRQVLRRRRRQARRRGLLLAARPRRRHHARVGPQHLDHRGRVGARRPSRGRRSRRGRQGRRHDRAGDRRVRDPARRRRAARRARRRAPQSCRRAHRPDRQAEVDPVHRGAAEDAVGQDHAPAPARRRARTRRSATRPRSPTRPWSTASSRATSPPRRPKTETRPLRVASRTLDLARRSRSCPAPAVVVDIDGVLSDASRRQHYLESPAPGLALVLRRVRRGPGHRGGAHGARRCSTRSCRSSCSPPGRTGCTTSPRPGCGATTSAGTC